VAGCPASELFEGCTEAVGESGGFTFHAGPGLRLYPIASAERGTAWLRLTARGTAGHGSRPADARAQRVAAMVKRHGVLGPGDHLKSAEPEGFQYEQPERSAEVRVQRTLDGRAALVREPEPVPLAPAEREQRALEVLGFTFGCGQPGPCRSPRPPSTTASGKPRSTSAAACASPPKTL